MKGGVGVSAAGCAAASSSILLWWWLWWARSALLLLWGLHWLISVWILGKPLGKCCNEENTGIESLHPDSKWLKELFGFAAAVVLTPLEWNQSQGSQSLVVLLLICSEAKRATRKTPLLSHLSLYSGFFTDKVLHQGKTMSVRGTSSVGKVSQPARKKCMNLEQWQKYPPHANEAQSCADELVIGYFNLKSEVVCYGCQHKSLLSIPTTYFWEEMT